MEIKPIEVFSEATNHAVVRMPGRHYPGSVVQGDTLSILCSLADEICRGSEGTVELHDLAVELRDILVERLAHYERSLDEHSISLPYTRRRVPG